MGKKRKEGFVGVPMNGDAAINDAKRLSCYHKDLVKTLEGNLDEEEEKSEEKLNPIKSMKLICTSSASPEEYTIYAEFRDSRVDIEIGSITVDNKKIIVRCTYGGKKAIILDTYYNVDGEFADEQERINFKQHICDFITEYIKNEFC